MVNWEQLITRQLKSSQLIKQLSEVESAYALNPCITVSREPCCRGRIIAQKAAKALKIGFFDKELVDLVAKTAQKRKKLIAALDEKTQGSVEAVVNSLLGMEALPEYAYIKSLAKVVCSIAGKKPAVIVGRGANFLLPQETNLRVRIIAPFKVRVRQAMKDDNINKEEARKRLIKVHRQRKQFISKYFNKNVSNANYYDLVLNTTYLTVEQGVEIIIAAFKKKFLK